MGTECPVTVLVSGRGSNLRALVDAQTHFRVSAVISNHSGAPALQFAREHGIYVECVERKDFANLAEFKAAVLGAVVKTKPNLVALAGFMMVLQPEFVDEFEGRLLNVHPSLLPDFAGLDTHQRVIEAKAEEHGCSVHFVDRGVDTGQLIAQAKVSVSEADTTQTLEARVLELEHRIYPWTVNAICKNAISLTGTKLVYSTSARAEAKQNNFIIFD